MKGWSRRRWGWLAAIVLAVLAIQWGDSADAPPAGDAVDLAPAQPPRGASIAGTPAPVVTEIRLDRLRREPYPPLKSDPFRGDLAFDPDSPAGDAFGSGGGQRAAGPPPPPPVPFAYMGKMLEGGETVVFLTRGDRNYVVRKGATIDGQYRVDAIGPRTMVLTYLPAKAKQSLAIGSAP
jgi:hypothetical protein